jgi:chorismate mutase
VSGPVVRAIRGAVTVEADTSELIREATTELVREVMDRNGLVPEDLISMIFTTTHDLVCEFPAVAARELGLSGVPLLCAQEIPVAGSMPRCVRVLVHCYAPADRTVRHVYLRDAKQLRLDLQE